MAERRSLVENEAGFTMIEVLISILIMTIGLLGLAAMQVRAQQAELESYQRAQALILAQDMADRINANRKAALCYNFTTNTTTGAPFAGFGGSAPTCGAFGTTITRARADADMSEWDATLDGAAEQIGVNQVGAMIGARGCVSLNTATTPNIYRVSVAWQGMIKTKDPALVDAALTCGSGQYGDEAQRRIVSITFPMACLNC